MGREIVRVEQAPWEYFRVQSATDSRAGEILAGLGGIQSAVNANTAVAWQNGRTLQEIASYQSAAVDVLRGIERSNWTRNSLLMEQNLALGQQITLQRESNQIQLGIAKILAAAYRVDISDVMPEYFPKPPIPEPPLLPKQIRISEARINASSMILKSLQDLLGAERVLPVAARYADLADEVLQELKPEGFTEAMIADLVRKGRVALNELGDLSVEYVAEQEEIEGIFGRSVEVSRMESILRGLNADLWKNGGTVYPILINSNFGEIPERDRIITAGYTLSSPPRRFDSKRTQVLISPCQPVEYIKTRSYDNPRKVLYANDIVILDGDFRVGLPISDRLVLTKWIKYGGDLDSPVGIRAFISIFAYSEELFRYIRWLANYREYRENSSGPYRPSERVSYSEESFYDDFYQLITSNHKHYPATLQMFDPQICYQVQKPENVMKAVNESQGARMLAGKMPKQLEEESERLEKEIEEKARQREEELRRLREEDEEMSRQFQEKYRRQKAQKEYDALPWYKKILISYEKFIK